MNIDLIPIPSWFWEIIDNSKPDLIKLEQKLEQLDKETLENYYGFYKAASQDICEPWSGPFIDDSIGHLSEDSTSDLTDWIVSQGYDYWASISALYEDEEAKEKALVEAFWTEDKVSKEGKHGSLVKWTYTISNPTYKGYQSPGYLPIPIYKHKFKLDIYDEEEKIFKRIDKLLW
ncbi:MAG: hypothetical protein K0S32_4526 [Bacteroidetes bacterium]|nr:hypothetical protein [Bacteroidota bacterium]